MSDLTPCNFCSLQRIKRRAAERGATVTTRRETSGDMRGWVAVIESDRDEPSSYFMELTDRCAC
jgi:hypothetical protein